MSDMKNVTAIVRPDFVQELIAALRKADVTRFYVSHVHAMGAGVDPKDYRLSLDEGSTYMEKAKVEFLCRAERVTTLLALIRDCACTGHRGDGLAIVSDVSDVVSVRTGDHDRTALL